MRWGHEVKRNLRAILALLLVAAIGLASGCVTKTSDQSETLAAEQVVREYFTYWNEKNIPEMEKRMTPDKKDIQWYMDDLEYVKLINVSEQKPVERGTKAFVVVFDIKQAHGGSIENGVNSWNYVLKRESDTSPWLISDWGHGGGLLE
jgi:hypothetical protein